MGLPKAPENAILASKNAGNHGMWEEEMSRSRRLATALGLCLAVAGTTPALGAEHTFDGGLLGKKSADKRRGGSQLPSRRSCISRDSRRNPDIHPVAP